MRVSNYDMVSLLFSWSIKKNEIPVMSFSLESKEVQLAVMMNYPGIYVE